MTMREKAEHVRRSQQSRFHTCHWPNCQRQVPPAMWGCRKHWFALPHSIRMAIWNAYVPGQEERGDPSPLYLEAARAAQEWIEAHAAS